MSPKAVIAGRSYQQLAIQRVTVTLLAKPSHAPASAPAYEAPVFNERPPKNTYAKLRGSRRTALLVMATGSGKTRTAAALTDIFLNHDWSRRILFLADHNALVSQAKDSFNEHLPEASAINMTTEKENDKTRLVFSTYPTMLNRIEASYRGAPIAIGQGQRRLKEPGPTSALVTSISSSLTSLTGVFTTGIWPSSIISMAW